MIAHTRNVSLLAASQALMLSAVVLSMTLAGILGATLAPDKGLATLPIAAMVVGTAIASIPASLLMRRLGRRTGFLIGAALGIAGSGLAATGLQIQSFSTFVVGHLLLGTYQGFANYFRFAAAEAAGPEQARRAISWVVGGGWWRGSGVRRAPNCSVGTRLAAAACLRRFVHGSGTLVAGGNGAAFATGPASRGYCSR